jgi:DNA-binding response OmpR family regulator
MTVLTTQHAAQVVQAALCPMCGNRSSAKEITLPGLLIDRQQRKVWVAGSEVRLTNLEYDLLVYFAQRPDMLVTNKELYREVWGYQYLPRTTRTIPAFVSRLRRKLWAIEGCSVTFQVVRGLGWRFRVE